MGRGYVRNEIDQQSIIGHVILQIRMGPIGPPNDTVTECIDQAFGKGNHIVVGVSLTIQGRGPRHRQAFGTCDFAPDIGVLTHEFDEELMQARVLVGASALVFKPATEIVSRQAQSERKHKIDRIKYKLEDAGAGGGVEVTKEYEETIARDQFLAKELTDIESAVGELRTLIRDLKEKIDTQFRDGVEKINQEFTKFFSLMFGGGHAFLSIVVEHKRPSKDDEEEDEIPVADDSGFEFERGIEINVSLPHKKVKDLHMLSGGERSLTSIALLFAMSQVNPPPFLVLDETDAALDEANSRRYGDMIENLSKYSQLIVVTHNRETMSRAKVLYGVTIGADGGSKLLSIKFEEAVKIAK